MQTIPVILTVALLFLDRTCTVSYRSRDSSLDIIEVTHVVEGYKNQQSGDGNGNRKEERGLRNHIKEEHGSPSTATIY